MYVDISNQARTKCTIADALFSLRWLNFLFLFRLQQTLIPWRHGDEPTSGRWPKSNQLQTQDGSHRCGDQAQGSTLLPD